MGFEEYFPFWNRLTEGQKEIFGGAITKRTAEKGIMVHHGGVDCVGLLMVISGQFRAYITSDEGREITLYRLLSRDMCLFSASCMLRSIEFDISVEAEQETEFYHIPVDTYKQLMDESAAVANYTNDIMSERFSDVMWLMDQILYKRMDARVSGFLLEESRLEGSDKLTITHETMARHLGSAREVVSRILKYLQQEGAIQLFRGGVKVTDFKKLESLAGDSVR